MAGSRRELRVWSIFLAWILVSGLTVVGCDKDGGGREPSPTGTSEAENGAKEQEAAKKAAEERMAGEKAAAEREAVLKAEAERVAAERVAALKAEAERAAAERAAALKAEAERAAAERAEAERVQAEQAAAERAAAERAKAERVAVERAEAERAEAERVAALNAKYWPQLERDMRAPTARCKREAAKIKGVILSMRKAVDRGDMRELRRLDRRLGDLVMPSAAAESAGDEVLDAYRAKGVTVDRFEEAFRAACDSEVPDAD